ncbi:recombination protein NinB [Alcanivorax sp.]|uniref:recombination protein NinB n=1 Tax=Alcanivorax sp. TaxID=1872427 RepID=UPI003A8F7C09
MSKEKVYRLREDNFRRALDHAEALLAEQFRKGRTALEMALREPKRSLDQNSKLWAILDDVACQCTLLINGEKAMATREEWKDVFTAALKRESRIAMGINGGVVMLGHSTSKMRKAEFSELIELIHAYGAENGVHWSEKAQAVYAEYREASQ